ncbi:hypothetical protein GCM10007276_06160 [Agaricicola taiwanensis]|uniref:C4-dicarboxylate ABC transporter substrate-binding protein n=1 Tax=Agaricicola taiwanensis TaxID=591372 RepID=A0A8J2VMB0_9RHOB|nr:TRAP transporter substrate-binding protein [Agaricicola taiwanensis]GGE31753.1 hypothetical protein GCM10007276_06160 [Agaricicola taiwanensis]
MQGTSRRTSLKLAAAAMAVGFFSAPALAQETYNWRIQTLWQPGTANQEAFERFAENVATMTDGQIKITPLPVGAIVGVNETLDAVSRGILDGQHPATVYWTGRNPVFAAIGDLNAAYDNPYQAMEYFYKYEGMEILKEAYKPLGLYPIGVAWWGVESIPTTRRVGGVADLKGLKIRLPQGMASELFEKFGAVPVNLPGSETFSAMDNGTIEATDWGTLAMNAELGFHDKAKFAIYPGVHSMPVGDVSIPLKVWEKLSPRLQKTLEIAVRDFSLDMIQTLEKQNLEVAEELKAEGVELVDWSEEDRREFRKAAVDTWNAYAGKNELTKRAVETQVSYLRKIGLID